MKKQIFAGFVLILLIASAGWSADPEMRACWISRFEWPSTDETTCKAHIQTMMQTLKQNNFNTVLFQIRGECNTLYPSPYEPWAPQFNWSNPGWDPVAYAIEQAHAQGLEFHAYINTHTMTQDVPPDPTTPQHIYNLHGKSGSSENWQIHGSDGQPAEKVDAYYWLSPGIPDAEAWTRQAIMHVVNTYNVDGIHFDRIRTPSSDYSHDPISEARFAGEGNPDGEAWGDWMRSQITRQLRKIYGAVNQVKPHVKISAAPFGICKKEPGGYQGTGTQSYYSWYQDSFGWMENHVLDAIFPMIYWDIGSAHPYEVLLADFLNHTGGRHIYGGSVTSTDYIAQVYETRNQGAQGNTIFSYNSVNFSGYLNGPYSEPADTPEMTWKTNPTTGIIVGYVRNISGDPVTDARINRVGDSYNYLSSGDGFYTILDVPPGTYQVTATKNDAGTVSATATLTAGEVVQVDLTLSTSKGTLNLNKAFYYLGDEISVILNDSDLAGMPTAQVKAISTTESVPETLTLTAQGGSGGFAGTIQLQAGSATSDGILQAAPGDTLTFTYYDADDGTGPSTTVVTATVDPHVVIYDETLDSNPGWTTQSLWGFGQPTGQTGDQGNPDPTSGYTGTSVYGYNLTGPYTDDMTTAQYLTTPAIDCSGGYSTIMTFYRWLNVEQNSSDQATLEVSNDGVQWFTVWENPDTTITDTAWNQQTFNISNAADYRTTLYLRWGMGPTDSGWNYAGWNIDDIQILQIPGGPAQLIIDNDETGFVMEGIWNRSTQGTPYGSNKRYTSPGDGSLTASWIFNGIPVGQYQIEFWINDNNYAADAHYYIRHDTAPAGGELVTASQNYQGDGWQNLGTYSFSSNTVQITLTNYWEAEGIYVVADAMRITLQEGKSMTPNWAIY